MSKIDDDNKTKNLQSRTYNLNYDQIFREITSGQCQWQNEDNYYFSFIIVLVGDYF